jgi:hypothetical protein
MSNFLLCTELGTGSGRVRRSVTDSIDLFAKVN